MPAEPHIGFIELSVVFVAATLLGFASHSPGGLGVFDAAMLVALWQYDKLRGVWQAVPPERVAHGILRLDGAPLGDKGALRLHWTRKLLK